MNISIQYIQQGTSLFYMLFEIYCKIIHVVMIVFPIVIPIRFRELLGFQWTQRNFHPFSFGLLSVADDLKFSLFLLCWTPFFGI